MVAGNNFHCDRFQMRSVGVAKVGLSQRTEIAKADLNDRTVVENLNP